MNRQTLRKLIAKGTMTWIAVFSLVLMVAMPALALMANSVGTREIKDHAIRSADIRNKAVTTDRIAPRAVKRGKIGKRAIRTEHVKYISDSKIRHSTKRLAVPAAAFTETTSDKTFTNTGGAVGGGTASYVAPVSLPDRAIITRIRFTYKDESNGSNMSFGLKRHHYPSDTAAQMSNTFITSGFTAGWRHLQDNSINSPTINNNDNSYYVWAAAGDERWIGQALITYSLAGP